MLQYEVLVSVSLHLLSGADLSSMSKTMVLDVPPRSFNSKVFSFALTVMTPPV